MHARQPKMKGIGPLKAGLGFRESELSWPLGQIGGRIARPPGAGAGAIDKSADHGAAAADFRVADLGVARFEHLRLGKLRFSFTE